MNVEIPLDLTRCFPIRLTNSKNEYSLSDARARVLACCDGSCQWDEITSDSPESLGFHEHDSDVFWWDRPIGTVATSQSSVLVLSANRVASELAIAGYLMETRTQRKTCILFIHASGAEDRADCEMIDGNKRSLLGNLLNLSSELNFIGDGIPRSSVNSDESLLAISAEIQLLVTTTILDENPSTILAPLGENGDPLSIAIRDAVLNVMSRGFLAKTDVLLIPADSLRLDADRECNRLQDCYGLSITPRPYPLRESRHFKPQMLKLALFGNACGVNSNFPHPCSVNEELMYVVEQAIMELSQHE
ncbi:hypothetical protein BH11PLA2_BH11PLA2_22560 [soil metagenome]